MPRSKIIMIFCLYVSITMIFYIVWIDNNNNNISNRKKLTDSIMFTSVESVNITNPHFCILLIVCDRFESIRSTLKQLISIRSDTNFRFKKRFPFEMNQTMMMINIPLIVSQDCGNQSVYDLIKRLITENSVQLHLVYPVTDDPIITNTSEKKLKGYYKISRHYKWAIDQTFIHYPTVDKMIIVEDDLNISPDFLEYFFTLAPIMDQDDSIYCISAWNDNGKDHLVDPSAHSLLYRTDFFPGLGWMLKRSIWNEVRDRWPLAYWDDWFRHPDQRRGRSCIRPELSRTSTSGFRGVSNGRFFKKHLQFIHHFERYYPFFDDRINILNNLIQSKYDFRWFFQVYNQSQDLDPMVMTRIDEIDIKKQFRILYYTKNELVKYATLFGLMRDFKHGVPRTAYKNIISFFYKGKRVYLAPPSNRTVDLI